MIFVSVGTQFPFDRLIHYMDEWAERSEEEIYTQIAQGRYLPKSMSWRRFMATAEFNQAVQSASLLVSHAGMGNIITAVENQKSIIVMNRQYKLGEHRNNHQGQGLAWMSQLRGVYTASTQQELYQLLEKRNQLEAPDTISADKRKSLVNFIDRALVDSVDHAIVT